MCSAAACRRGCFKISARSQGLAYAIFSEMNSYRDSGVLSVYAGTSLETAAQLVRSVLAEFRKLKDEPLSRRRVAPRERSSERRDTSGAGRQRPADEQPCEISHVFNRYFSPSELIALLEKVTPADVQQIARDFFHPERLAASVVGNLDGFELTREHLTF